MSISSFESVFNNLILITVSQQLYLNQDITHYVLLILFTILLFYVHFLVLKRNLKSLIENSINKGREKKGSEQH